MSTYLRGFLGPHRPDVIPPDNPDAVWKSLQPESQAILRELSDAFHAVDETVLRGYLALGSVTFKTPETIESKRLQIMKTSSFKEMVKPDRKDGELLGYLADERYLRIWQDLLNFTTTYVSHEYDFAEVLVANLVEDTEGLAEAMHRSSNIRENFPAITRMVEGRCKEINSFLSTQEAQYLRGGREMRSVPHHLQNRLRMPRKFGKPKDAEHIEDILPSLMATGALTTALQLASFFKIDPWNRAEHYNNADILGLLQAMFVQWLGLFLTALPLFQNKALRQPFILGLIAATFLMSTLAPALYGSLGLAWANLLMYFAAFCQTQVVLQLLRGLQSEIKIPRKLD
ncbi:hypothetical protein OQA88_12284 [Cercophora sp. LCS_1]